MSAAAGVAVLSGPYLEHGIVALVLLAFAGGFIGVLIFRADRAIAGEMDAAEQPRREREGP